MSTKKHHEKRSFALKTSRILYKNFKYFVSQHILIIRPTNNPDNRISVVYLGASYQTWAPSQVIKGWMDPLSGEEESRAPFHSPHRGLKALLCQPATTRWECVDAAMSGVEPWLDGSRSYPRWKLGHPSGERRDGGRNVVGRWLVDRQETIKPVDRGTRDEYRPISLLSFPRPFHFSSLFLSLIGQSLHKRSPCFYQSTRFE